MNTMKNDTTNPIPMRLKEARENAGFSRSQLAQLTDIPEKSIEKFEYGTMEPSISRLKEICSHLDVTIYAIMGEENTAIASLGPAPVSSFPQPTEQPSSANDEETALVVVNKNLEELDGLHANNFETGRRRSLALVGSLEAQLKFLEPDELIQTAEQRGVYKGECPTSFNLFDIFKENPEEAQNYCGLIEERIIDTAVLGVDLYTVELKALDNLAGEFENIYRPFWGWQAHDKIVPKIRAVLREKAISGKGIDFDDREVFPRRR